MDYLSIWDIVLLPFYLIIIYLFAYKKKQKNIISNPEYEYYILGLFFKIFGGIALCLIYVFYYGGGDTCAYYKNSVAMVNMLFKDSSVFFSILSGNLSYSNYFNFDYSTGGLSHYMYKDPKTFAVVRFSTIFALFGFKNFLITTVLIATITYTGLVI